MDENKTSKLGELSSLNAGSIIQALGGIRPAAAKLGVPVTTVQGWKGRGRIPENRIIELKRVLAELGLELTGEKLSSQADTLKARSYVAAKDANDPSTHLDNVPEETTPETSERFSTPDEDMVENPNKKNNLQRHIKILSLVATIALLISCIAFFLMAIGLLKPDLIEAIKKKFSDNKASVSIKSDVRISENLESIKGTLSNALKAREQLRERIQGIEQGLEGVAEQISQIEAVMARLRLETDDSREKFNNLEGRFGQTNRQLDAMSKTNTRELKASIHEVKEAMTLIEEKMKMIQKPQEVLVSKLPKTDTTESQRIGEALFLDSAIGQLEVLIRSGEVYSSALARIRRASGADPSIVRVVEEMRKVPDMRVASQDTLLKELERIGSILSVGRSTPGKDSLLDSMWRQVKTTIGLRRIGGDSGSPVTQTENAVLLGDWNAALKVTAGYGARVNLWRKKVEYRLRVEELLADLHVMARSRETAENPSVQAVEKLEVEK